jgi:soluble lytic murein transglycosylase-like protein
MPNIIQVAEDLKNAPDQWLAQQMQQPSGSAPPWLVASEVARRQRLRDGSSKAQAPQSSVSEDLIKSLYARIPPTAGLMPQGGPPTPPGMPPVNLSPGSNPSTLGAAPGGTPPGNFRMPARMAGGGQFDDDSEEEQPDDSDSEPSDTPRLPITFGTMPGSRLLQNPSRRAQMDQLIAPPAQQPQMPMPATAPQTAPATSAAAAPPPKATYRVQTNHPEAFHSAYDDQAGYALAGGDPQIKMSLDWLVNRAAKQYQVPPELIKTVIQKESSGRADAIGPKTSTGEHAMGLMQVLPSTAGDYGVTDPTQLLDPARNVDVGTRHLKYLLGLYQGDVHTALVAYNQGQGAVARQLRAGKPFYSAATTYADAINKDYNAQRAKLNLSPTPSVDPSVLQSRLLGPREDYAEANLQPAADTATTTTEPPPPAATTTDAATTAAPNAPPAPDSTRPIIAPAVERPADLRELDRQFERASNDLATTLAKVTPYDPRVTTTQEAIQGYKQRIRTFIGPEPDNSKFQQSFQELTAMAQKLLHPGIGDMLMSWGAHMMASKQHNFLAAMGEASLASQADYEKQQAQGRGLWIQALDLGLKLQDRTNTYNTKVGEMAMQEQRMDQAAGTAQYTQQFNLAKEKRLELQEVARERAKAQAELDKTFAASPAGRLAQINQFRKSIGQPEITMQNASDSEKMYYEFGTKPSASASHDTEVSLAVKAASGDAQAQKALQILGKGDAGLEAYLAGGAQPGASGVPGQPTRLGPVATPPAAAATGPSPVQPDPTESLVRGTPSLGYPPTGRNEAILANLPRGEADMIRRMVDYKLVLPARQSMNKPIWQNRVQAAGLYDPNFNQSTYEQRAKTQKDFTSGMEARQINALNTLMGHAMRLQKNWTALHNYGGWATPFNAPANWLLQAKGDPRISPTIMDLQAVPEEMMKLWRSAGGSDADLAGWKKALHLNMAPAEQKKAIEEVLGLAEGKLRGLRNQYENAMGRPADFHFLAPESSEFLKRYGIDHRDIDPGYAVQPGGFGGGGGAAAGGGSKVMLGGREIIPQNGRWIYKDSGQAVQ